MHDTNVMGTEWGDDRQDSREGVEEPELRVALRRAVGNKSLFVIFSPIFLLSGLCTGLPSFALSHGHSCGASVMGYDPAPDLEFSRSSHIADM